MKEGRTVRSERRKDCQERREERLSEGDPGMTRGVPGEVPEGVPVKAEDGILWL